MITFLLQTQAILLTEWIQKQMTATRELGPQRQPGSHATHAATPRAGTEAAGSPGSPRVDLDKRLLLNNSTFPWKKQWHFPTWKRLLLKFLFIERLKAQLCSKMAQQRGL